MKFTGTMSSTEDSKVGGSEGNASADGATGPTAVSTSPVTNGTDTSTTTSSQSSSGGLLTPRDFTGEKDEGDFSEYLWMENMEDYDQEIMRQLEEDILISHYTDLYEDSLLEDGSAGPTTASLCVVNGPILPSLGDPTSDDMGDVTRQFARSINLNSTVSANSRLNPNAAEFVPKAFGNVSYQN